MQHNNLSNFSNSGAAPRQKTSHSQMQSKHNYQLRANKTRLQKHLIDQSMTSNSNPQDTEDCED